MFNLFDQKDGILTIYKPGIIDAGKVIIEAEDNSNFAKAELNDMFSEMISSFEHSKVVILKQLRRKESSAELYNDINEFKVWLIRNQTSAPVMAVLQQLKSFCKKHRIELPRINIVFGDTDEEAIFNTDMYFNNTYDREWFDDEMMQKLIKDIDKSEVESAFAIKSPVFGVIPAEKLSGGVKTLMLIYNHPEMIFNASTCGDNCSKWIKKFSEEKDFIINLYHAMIFPKEKINAYILNGGEVIHSMDELFLCADKYCRS